MAIEKKEAIVVLETHKDLPNDLQLRHILKQVYELYYDVDLDIVEIAKDEANRLDIELNTF